MNRLNTEKRAQIIGCLVEGMSIRATCRVTGAAKNTVTKLLVDLGDACSAYMDEAMRDLPCKRLEVDEIWTFVGAKAKNVAPDHHEGWGDAWTFVAIDADTKLVPCWMIGERNMPDAKAFLTDLAERMRNRIQLSTDGHRMYAKAVPGVFGHEIDYGVIVKYYGKAQPEERRYSPMVCTKVESTPKIGDPDPALISTSYIERQNLTMRMGMRRFTRLTNAFSKKLENLVAAEALHFMHYNFARPHKTLSKPYPTTPAMASGVADHVWSLEDIVGLLTRT
jgi:IS1 family transposase